MIPFEAVFFDMDGTFVNSEPHWLAGETELMAEYGHAWTKADQQYCLGGPLSKVGRYMWELAGEKESPEWFHHELVRRTLTHFRVLDFESSASTSSTTPARGRTKLWHKLKPKIARR